MIDSELFYEERIIPPTLDFSRDSEFLDTGIPGFSPYLRDRGITRETVFKYQIGLGESEERIIFPVRNFDGKTNGLICRYVNPGAGPRYRKSGNQYPVWPMDFLVDISPGDYIIVTEGLFSCLRIASVDARFKVVSLAGAKANAEIVATLSPWNPIIIYDKDGAGIRAAKRMKAFRPDWLVLTAKTAPDDMLDNAQVKAFVDKVYDKLMGIETRKAYSKIEKVMLDAGKAFEDTVRMTSRI